CSPAFPTASASRSSAARITRRSGRGQGSKLWIHHPLSSWFWDAFTSCTWTIPGQVSCAHLMGAPHLSSAATNLCCPLRKSPPRAEVTREGILRLDQKMLDSWWISFGYGDVSLWRTFERDWSQRQPPTAK